MGTLLFELPCQTSPRILLYVGFFHVLLTYTLPPLIGFGLQTTLNVDPCVIAVVVATLPPTAKDCACAVTEPFQPVRLVSISTGLRCLPRSFIPWLTPKLSKHNDLYHSYAASKEIFFNSINRVH